MKTKRKRKVQFAELLDMDNPAVVFEEVKYNFINHYPVEEFLIVRKTFKDFNDLYDGKYPGYCACNTKYHDKIHTTDALLTISRLIDGYNLSNTNKLPTDKVVIALISTILHDTGYIQNKRDTKGTGAKYTLNHVERSVEFLKKYFKRNGLSKKDFISGMNMIRCTGLFTNLSNIPFTGKEEKTLGLMLGTSDLLGQMASRTYLERLIYLYREFKEGHVKGYTSELNLLKKTLSFYDSIKIRLKTDLESVNKYARIHFKERYGINKDMYEESITDQIRYLKYILKRRPETYRSKLKRKIVIH